MNKNNIHQFNLSKQGTVTGSFTMKGNALLKFAHSAIREHGEYKKGNYSLDVSSLPLYEKKLFISCFADAEEFEFACKSAEAAEAVFAEYKSEIQSCIDDECFEVYKEDMEEMGMQLLHYSGSEEIYWARR